MDNRQARYEARRRESGWRMISVRLDAETLAALKQALAAGSISAPEALDQAYQIGFADGLKSA